MSTNPNTVNGLTVWENTVKTRLDAMFQHRPHVVWLYSEGQWRDWINGSNNIHRFSQLSVGTAILFNSFYDRPPGSPNQPGPGPVAGRTFPPYHEYKDQKKTATLIKDLKAMGMSVLGYVSPHRWVKAGYEGQHLLEEIKFQGWDGVYLDGWGFSDIWETLDILTRIKSRGYKIYLHGSIQPHRPDADEPGLITPGRINYRMPGWELADWVLWGETNAIAKNTPTIDFIRWFKHNVSQVERIPGVVPSYKPSPGSPWDNKPDQMYAALLPLLCLETHIGVHNFWQLETHGYINSYHEMQRAYQTNPVELIQRIASTW